VLPEQGAPAHRRLERRAGGGHLEAAQQSLDKGGLQVE